MQGRLAGKTAFITGIGGGQGRAAALLFAREGAQVYGTDIDPEGASETVRLVRTEGGRIHSMHPLDLTEEDAPRRWIDDGVQRFGRIDVLYNNAGQVMFRRIDDAEAWQAWRVTIRGELDLVFATILAAWPHLVAQGGSASIITTSSTAARRGGPLPITSPGSSAAHSATKAGVIGLMKQVAAEGAPHGIRANSILPGFIDSPATERILAHPGAPERIAQSLPLRRIGRPEDIAKVALFFASDDSAWVTAEELTVDGGAVSITEIGG